MTSDLRPINRGYLQLKLGALAAEARLIRRKERAIAKAQKKTRTYAALKGIKPEELPGFLDGERALFGITTHRRVKVRREARESGLAYGFLRGNPYNIMERTAYEMPNWKNVESIARRFDDGDWRVTGQQFSMWLVSAKVMHPKTGEFLEKP